MTVFDVTLTTLSPVHIGDGNELKKDFDFVIHNGQTLRVNEDAFLRAKEDKVRPGRDGKYPAPGQLLEAADYKNQALFRYALRGQPRSRKTDARVKTFIKDVFDQPYIPGSSLKGALRTALAWTGWEEVNPKFDRQAIDRRKNWAGQPLEKKLFGDNPNHDLLKSLKVSDLLGPGKPEEYLLLVNAHVLTAKSAGSPIELEAVAGNKDFHGTLTIDESFFSPMAERELRFNNRRHWLDELMARVQAHSQARIEQLATWFEQASGADAIARFYRQLAGAEMKPTQAFLQLGWGGGWDGKTFWTHLQKDPEFFEEIVDDFRLHRAGRNAPPRRTGDPFPRSKRAAMVVKNNVSRPAAPFGWVVMEMNPR